MTSPSLQRFAVLGTGGMGTALAILLARSASTVTLWGRSPKRIADLARLRENRLHLPGVLLPDSVRPSADAAEAVASADLIVVAIPSAFLRSITAGIADAIPTATPVLSVVKGIERETFARPSEIISEAWGSRPVAVLSGPSHAEEIARGLPASVVVAGEEELSIQVRNALSGAAFRVYTNPDALGVELSGALKNILGIAAGICEGLGFGDNAKAALLTRGLVEIARFGVSLGAQFSTFWGLAGVGDVITTCYSPFGRNRAVGVKIGQGIGLAEVLGAMNDVVEGVFTTRSVYEQARERGIVMPIIDEVHHILFEGKSPRLAVTDLMTRDPKVELA
jgi:glycerol-3-phosphate dehydrogenase (NAD(P)+)